MQFDEIIKCICCIYDNIHMAIQSYSSIAIRCASYALKCILSIYSYKIYSSVAWE